MTHPESPSYVLEADDPERRERLLRWYCRAGLRLVPVYELRPDGSCSCDAGCTDKDQGKHPRLGRWRQVASADWERVAAWHRQWPASNWAWVLDDHFVVDSDPRNGGFGPDTFYLDWEEHLGFPLPSTRCATTGGGGVHAVFANPGLGEVRSGKLWLDGRALRGLEVKGVGGYVLVEPSNHVSGRRYRWWGFEEAAEPTPELLALRSRRAPAQVHPSQGSDRDSGDHPSTDRGTGERFDWEEALTPGAVPPGDQQTTLYRAGASARARRLPEEVALKWITDVARAFAPDDPSDPWTDEHARVIWERVQRELPEGTGLELTEEQRGVAESMVREFRERQLRQRPADAGTVIDIQTRRAVGLDDRSADEPPSERPVDVLVAPPPGEPVATARWLIEQLWSHEDGVTLLYWRETFLHWERGAWRIVEDQAVRTAVYERLETVVYESADGPRLWQPTTNRVNQVIDALRAVTFLDGRVEAGTWLTRRENDPDPRELVAVGNGLLHRPDRVRLEHTPRLFNLTCVPFDYDPEATCHRWDGFLNQLWLGSSGMTREMATALDSTACESMNVLEEFFGYVLSGRTDIHKILLLIGPSRSGKGTILRVLTALVGADDVAAPTLESLSKNFGLQPLIGKKLVTFTDARLDTGARTSTIVERLLSLSGEDAITVDRKNRSQWTGKLGVRMILVSNELPELRDASGAVAERFLLLPPLTRSWLGREDLGLTDDLLRELPGVLNRALDGLDRLTARGRFEEPQAAADARERLRGLASPTLTFVEECLEVGDPTWEVETSEVFQAWRMWCINANEPPGGQAAFGRALHAVIPTLGKSRPRVQGVKRLHYVGIRLRSTALTASSVDFSSHRWPQ